VSGGGSGASSHPSWVTCSLQAWIEISRDAGRGQSASIELSKAG